MSTPSTFGPFDIVARIGAGGMAETFVAIRRGPGGFEQRVCLKRVLPAYELDPEFVRLFVEEARLSASLRHAAVVQVLDFGVAEGSHYLALELVEGLDLREMLRRLHRHDRRLGHELVAYIGVELAGALEYAHGMRVVHRDVSPSNVLVSRAGEVKLGDFGIAKALSNTGGMTRSGMLKGKVPYMSPEYARTGVVDARVDLFALGVLLFEALAGRRPYDGATDLDTLARSTEGRHPPLAELVPEAPEPLRRAVETLIRPDPADRFATAGQAVEALAPCAPQAAFARRTLGALVRELEDLGPVAPSAGPVRSVTPATGSAAARVTTPAAGLSAARPAATVLLRDGDVDASTRTPTPVPVPAPPDAATRTAWHAPSSAAPTLVDSTPPPGAIDWIPGAVRAADHDPAGTSSAITVTTPQPVSSPMTPGAVQAARAHTGTPALPTADRAVRVAGPSRRLLLVGLVVAAAGIGVTSLMLWQRAAGSAGGTAEVVPSAPPSSPPISPPSTLQRPATDRAEPSSDRPEPSSAASGTVSAPSGPATPPPDVSPTRGSNDVPQPREGTAATPTAQSVEPAQTTERDTPSENGQEGTVTVSVRPFGRVWIDGMPYGAGPITRRLRA
ncbi:MAG: protein kinase, partial [Myxococcota bacterium]|nr:protein kinase [Myxococcota bacterium]